MEFTLPEVAYQALLFVVVYFILKKTVFERFLENLEARHHRTHGALAEAEALRTETARLQADYEVQLAEMRRQASVARDEIRRQAEASEREILEAARADAAKSLAEARAEIQKQTDAARVSLRGEIETISQQVLAALMQ